MADDARWIADAGGGNASTVCDAFSVSVGNGCAGSAFGLVAVEGDDGGGRGVSLVCDTLDFASLVSVCGCCRCLRGDDEVGFGDIGSLVTSCGFLDCKRAWGIGAAWLVALRSGCFGSSSSGAACFFS